MVDAHLKYETHMIDNQSQILMNIIHFQPIQTCWKILCGSPAKAGTIINKLYPDEI